MTTPAAPTGPPIACASANMTSRSLRTTGDRRLAGKVAIVTGAASGIGRASAKALCEQGAVVFLADVDTAACRRATVDLGLQPTRALQLDVSDPTAWHRAVELVIGATGRLDVLVNNAGVAGRGGIADADPQGWRQVMSINLDGVFYGMRAALPALRANAPSSIINVSSIAGLVGFKGSVAYSASKWGVQGLTRTAALELGADGVRVNSIHPGSVATPLTADLTRGIGQIPAGRVGEPEEIAALVVFLASDESRFINGAAIPVDGGETAGNNLRGLL